MYMRYSQRTVKLTSPFILLLCITILAVSLRLINQTPYKIYPDSYQNLLVAQNLRQFHQVTGTLGPQGMFYPPYFMWSRPGYPILISVVAVLVGNPTLSASFISLLAGIAAIPVTYLAVKHLFQNHHLGLVAAFLLTISFSHVVWSGFILTETTGVFLLTLTLALVLPTLTRPSLFAQWHDLLAGATFGFAVFTRYEYLILLLPLLGAILVSHSSSWIKATNFTAAFGLVAAIIVASFYSLPTVITAISTQPTSTNLSQIVPMEGLATFMKQDLLIISMFLIGSLVLIHQKQYKLVGFCFLSIGLLLPIYGLVNSTNERYMTHLLPFMVIPASVGTYFSVRAKYLRWFLVILTLTQLVITLQGVQNWEGGTWHRRSYEDAAAHRVAQFTTDPRAVLVVSFPEPYHLATTRSTHSVSPQYPYVYLTNIDPTTPVYVVLDMGMADLFPDFYRLIETTFTDRLITQFRVGEAYHFAIKSLPESVPVSLYQTTVQELNHRITTPDSP